MLPDSPPGSKGQNAPFIDPFVTEPLAEGAQGPAATETFPGCEHINPTVVVQAPSPGAGAGGGGIGQAQAGAAAPEAHPAAQGAQAAPGGPNYLPLDDPAVLASMAEKEAQADEAAKAAL